MQVEITAQRVVEILLTPEGVPLPKFAAEDLSSSAEEFMSVLGRPGKGGRKPKRPAGTETTAMAELREMLGESEIRTHQGARVEIWEVDEAGTVAIGARLSADDIDRGQKIPSQIESGIDLCEKLGLSVRYVVAATRMSGDRSEKDRTDLEFLRAAIERGHVDTVVYREVDRLARRSGVRDEFWRFLEATGTELYFSLKGRVTDWGQVARSGVTPRMTA